MRWERGHPDIASPHRRRYAWAGTLLVTRGTFRMIPLYATHRQETFSDALVRAVIAGAELRYQPGAQPDDDSVDFTICGRGPAGTLRSPKLDIQLKCQMGSPPTKDPWPFVLSLKNYDDLRPTDVHIPRILVVVVVPTDVGQWIEQDTQRLLLRHCAWWVSLRGMPAVSNTSRVTIPLPIGQEFNVPALHDLFQRVGGGGQP